MMDWRLFQINTWKQISTSQVGNEVFIQPLFIQRRLALSQQCRDLASWSCTHYRLAAAQCDHSLLLSATGSCPVNDRSRLLHGANWKLSVFFEDSTEIQFTHQNVFPLSPSVVWRRGFKVSVSDFHSALWGWASPQLKPVSSTHNVLLSITWKPVLTPTLWSSWMSDGWCTRLSLQKPGFSSLLWPRSKSDLMSVLYMNYVTWHDSCKLTYKTERSYFLQKNKMFLNPTKQRPFDHVYNGTKVIIWRQRRLCFHISPVDGWLIGQQDYKNKNLDLADLKGTVGLGEGVRSADGHSSLRALS